MKFKILLIITLLFLPDLIFAQTDLVTIYQQSLHADPTYAIAQSTSFSQEENVAISRAGLLPSLQLTGQANEAENDVGNPATNGTNSQYNLNLTQPLFNYGNWLTLQESQFSAKSAQATYAASLQDLMLRVAYAYYAAASAEATYQLSLQNQKILLQEYHLSQVRFKAGLVKTADVADAKAAYDSSNLNVVSFENDYKDAMADLQKITGENYQNIAILKKEFPLISPNPNDLSAWLNICEKQNLHILAKRFNMEAARTQIGVEQAGSLPVVDANAGLSGNQSKNNGIASTSTNSGTVGVSLNFPIYQGGLVVAQTRQASFDYRTAQANYLSAYRDAINQTQKSYNDVNAALIKIKLGKEAVESNQIAFNNTKVAYEGGIRNMLDVLTAQQSLYSAQLTYLQAQYTYFQALLSLKAAAGTLNVNDLISVNSWLM